MLAEAAIYAVLAKIGRPNIAAEIAAINLGYLAIATDHAALQFGRHRLAELVQQNERAFVGHVKIAAQCQRRLALYLIAENGDGREIAAQRQLVAGKQRAAGKREILFASPATEPGRTLQAPAINCKISYVIGYRMR